MDGFERQFCIILLQLGAIVAAARVGGVLFRKFGQPEVVGEIIIGLLLGPSCWGRISPDWLQIAPTGDTALAFRVLSELGLVLLMFLIGLDFNFSHLREVGKTACGVAVAGIVLPFGLGIVVSLGIHSFVAEDVSRWGFVLFFATALSITAIPVLGRIMVELGIHRTPLGTLTITAASIDDALGWILLASVGSLVQGGFEVTRLVTSLAGLFAFGVIVVCVVRFSLRNWKEYHAANAGDGALSLKLNALLMVCVLLSAAMTSALGVFAILGPFILGAALSTHRTLADSVIKAWQPMVYGLFLPIFFTYTGLRTDIGALNEPWLWGICLLVVVTATLGKVLGCGLAARWGGCTWRDSAAVAVMMNTRALMGLLAVNVGRSLGVVPDEVASMLVIMAVLTTLLTTPLLRRLIQLETAIQVNVPITPKPSTL